MEFPRNSLETLQAHDPLAANMELEQGLGTTALGTVLDLELGPGFDMGASAGPAESRSGVGKGMSSVDPDAQQRLSLQDPQTPLDSRTTQRHGSDTGGS